MIDFKSGAVLAAVLLASGASAQADMAPASPPMQAGVPAVPAEGPDRAAIHAAAAAKREADLALLLDLKPNQQALLHALLASMDDHGGGKDRDGMPPHHGPAGGMYPHEGPKASGDTPPPGGPDGHDGPPPERSFAERLADMQAHLDRHTQKEQARLAAARAFYTALDPRQQQKFEALQRLHHAGMHDGPPPPPPGDMHGPMADRGPGDDGPPPHP